MGLLELDHFRPDRPRAGAREMAISCENVGVRYPGGHGREDVKSRVHNLIRGRKSKGEHWALRGLDLSVTSGEILGVIGRNGAGKSTLCRLISRILRPDEGRLDVTGEVAALLTFGTGFDLRLTGRENIYRNAMMLGMPRRRVDELYAEIVEFSGVGDFIDQAMKTYSTGMRARLGFSVAACLEPEVLMLDEALSVGDLEFFHRASQKIQEVIAHCKLVVVVTHRLEFVENVCTRAAWIDKGTLQAYGLPGDVVGAYRATIKTPPRPEKQRITAELKETETEVRPHDVIVARNVGVRYRLAETGGAGRSIVTRLRLPLFGPRMNRVHWALRGVDLRVHEGDILGVIGPNGAGKTTLCKTLAGIYRPDEGDVAVEGEVSALLTFGTGFHPQLSGRDNVFRNGMMLGIPKKRIREVVDEIIEFSGIGERIDDPVKNYSSGMRSRLGFSVAAILKPDVFIIDEALNAGDADFYQRAAAKIQDLITRARVVIVVTHNLAFVDRVCTRAIWLHKGEMIFDGDPKEAVKRYRDAAHRKIDPLVAAGKTTPETA